MLITCTFDTQTKEMVVKTGDTVLDDVCEFSCCCDYGCMIRQEKEDEEEGMKSYQVTMAKENLKNREFYKDSNIPGYITKVDNSMLVEELRKIFK